MAYTPDQPVFERHLECFDAYLAHTDEKTVTLNAVVEGIRERAPNVWARMQDSSRLFTALYVGVGSGGGLEIPLTGKIIDMRGGVSGLQVNCVDASTQMRDQFMDRLSAPHGQDLSQPVTPELITEYECRRFEEEGYRPPAADLALASHSWYFIPEWEDQPPATNTLKKFADTVNPDGVGLIITYSKKSDSHSLRASYLEAVGSERVKASGEEIASAAKKIDIPVEEELIESRTSIESCFDSQGNFCPNRVGEMIISFLIGAEWKMLQPKIRQQVARKLIDLVDQNGEPNLRFIDTAAWIVHKES